MGFATAKKFCQNGIKTYIIGRSKEKTDSACKELGAHAIPIIFDLNDLQGIPDLIKGIVKKDSINILVNNAGINLKKEFIDVTDEDFLKIIQTNVLSVFSISREVVKSMLNSGGGTVINISSMASQYGIPNVIAYSASKGAIEAMTRSMAVDLAKYNIRVNCIAPGFIKTKMSAKAFKSDPDRKNKVISRTPLGVLGDPKDIANAIFYFSSNDSTFITGTVLPVDGGNSIGF